MSSGGMRRPPSPPAGWRSIRPWNRLTLHVREITPVSVTFILLSSIALRTWADGGSGSNDDYYNDDSDHAGPSHSHAMPPPKLPLKPLPMSELLGRGLAVKVNNAPWQRVVMHIDDDADVEATVILYGLHPARTYDVELALVAGEETMRGKISTEGGSDGEDFSFIMTGEDLTEDEALVMPIPNPAPNNTTTTTATTLPLTPAQTRPPSPVLDPPPLAQPPPRAMTVEERASQLLHELTSLDTEKEALITRLKTARRESQRADAALRSEIDALKRASERGAQADLRSRQKTLALQEATKQSLAAAVEADAEVKVVEASMPALESRAAKVEREYAKVKERVEKERLAASESMKADKKHVGDLEAELGGLKNRLERLNTRKDKLVLETVPDLERELGVLGRKIEEAEAEQRAELEGVSGGGGGSGDWRGMTMNPLASPQDMARQNSLPHFAGTISPPLSSRSPHGAAAAAAGRMAA